MIHQKNWMEAPKSCDTFVALPPATGNGCVVFGKNSDRPGNEVQELVYKPAAKYDPGTKLQCTYIEIDQAPSTYGVVLSKPAWMWGAEMGANEKGVCIGNEAVWTKLNSDDDLVERLLGMDLLRLGLERGSNARESVEVITSLLEKHGQGGSCVEGGDWSYHNSFIIADSTEAWVLETASQLWAAEKITEGVRNISNQLTITTKFDLSSENLLEKATEAGLYKPSDGPFNFAKVLDVSSLDFRNDRFCNGSKLLKQLSSNGTFGVADMMKILRDEDSGINMGSGTCGSQVSLLPKNTAAASVIPCCHWFTATPSPDVSFFKPFVFGPSSSVGSLTMSPDYGEKDPRIVKPRFKSKVDRRHELYKYHEKLCSLLVRDEAKANKIVKNLKELESNCIGDMEEILKNFDEASFVKVSNLFEHMCSLEMNFYKDT